MATDDNPRNMWTEEEDGMLLANIRKNIILNTNIPTKTPMQCASRLSVISTKNGDVPWSTEEDNQLVHNINNGYCLTEGLPTRNIYECNDRAHHFSQIEWTKAEDKQLVANANDGLSLDASLPNKTLQQCQEHIRGLWTNADDDCLEEIMKDYPPPPNGHGHPWEEITAKAFPDGSKTKKQVRIRFRNVIDQGRRDRDAAARRKASPALQLEFSLQKKEERSKRKHAGDVDDFISRNLGVDGTVVSVDAQAKELVSQWMTKRQNENLKRDETLTEISLAAQDSFVELTLSAEDGAREDRQFLIDVLSPATKRRRIAGGEETQQVSQPRRRRRQPRCQRQRRTSVASPQPVLPTAGGPPFASLPRRTMASPQPLLPTAGGPPFASLPRRTMASPPPSSYLARVASRDESFDESIDAYSPSDDSESSPPRRYNQANPPPNSPTDAMLQDGGPPLFAAARPEPGTPVVHQQPNQSLGGYVFGATPVPAPSKNTGLYNGFGN